MLNKVFRKLISWLLYLMWLLAAVFVLVLVLEFAARFFFPQWVSIYQDNVKGWQYDEQLGWKGRPNVSAQIEHPEFSITLETNSKGFRDKEYSYERNDKKRVLVLGDSYTWGYGVENGERFTDYLEEMMPQWEVINAGVSGYGTDQELLLYRYEGKKYQPDIVMLLMFYNDYENNFSSEQYTYNKPYFLLGKDGQTLTLENSPVPNSSLGQRVERYVEHDSFLLVRIKSVWNLLSFILREAVFGPQKGTFGFARYHETLGITHRLLDEVRHEVEASGSEFILLGYPVRRGITKHLNQYADTNGYQYLYLDPYFEAAGEEDLIIPNDLHWNKKGHELAARVIAAYLLENGFAEASDFKEPPVQPPKS